jgi:hypothetical protein
MHEQEIVFALMPPKFQVTISYLYPHHLTSNQISLLPIYFDDGQARQITVLSQSQRPRWLTLTLRTLIVVGIIAVLYALFELVDGECSGGPCPGRDRHPRGRTSRSPQARVAQCAQRVPSRALSGRKRGPGVVSKSTFMDALFCFDLSR